MKSNSSLSCCALTGRNEGLRDREREINRKEREREITSCCALTGRNERLRDREREIKRKEREREITSCYPLHIKLH